MILFIDDEPEYVQSYVEELRDAGHEVIIEKTVDSALNFVSDNKDRLELIVLDIMMPAGTAFRDIDTYGTLRTGLSVYDRIRQHSSEYPIIVLTNVTKVEVELKFANEKRCLVFRKDQCLPFELVAHVREMLK